MMYKEIEEEKLSLNDIININKKLSELEAISKYNTEKLDNQFKQIDYQLKQITEMSAWINKSQGSRTTIIFILSFVQIILFASLSWVFTHINDAQDQILILNQKMEEIDKYIDKDVVTRRYLSNKLSSFKHKIGIFKKTSNSPDEENEE